MKLTHAHDWQYMDCIDPHAFADWLYDADAAGISGMKQLARQQRLGAAVRYAARWLRHEVVIELWWDRQIGEAA